MDRRFAWLGAAAGGLAVWQWRWRRRKPKPEPHEEDPAESLRAKREQSRAVADERERFEERETPVDQAPDPEERRRSVHEEARTRMDELRGEEASAGRDVDGTSRQGEGGRRACGHQGEGDGGRAADEARARTGVRRARAEDVRADR